jgi:ferric-dicitrate binding protein FerR (iron transport regulator)
MVRKKNKQKIEDLYLEYIDGQLSEDELQEINGYKQNDASFKQQWKSLEKIWNAEPVVSKAQFSPDKAFNKLKPKLRKQYNARLFKRSSHTDSWSVLVAAVLIAVLCLAVAIRFITRDTWEPNSPTIPKHRKEVEFIAKTTNQKEQKKWLHYQTHSGERKNIKLPDGTTVQLNGQSSLAYLSNSYGNGTRTVTLTGEAFFQVTKDATHPFIVKTTDGLQTKVLGTKFNVMTNTIGQVKVSLLEGRVQISSPKQKGDVLLKPGEQACYKNNQGIEVTNFDAAVVTAWRNGNLYFNESSLADVGAALQRHFGKKIKIEATLVNHRITGEFKEKTIDEIIKNIAFVTRCKCFFSKDSTKIYLWN